MEYGVYFMDRPVGKVRLSRQGLYYRFQCRCQLSGEVVCRLWVACGGRRERLGVVVPMDGGFGLDTRLPVKRLGEGAWTFTLAPLHEALAGAWVPLGPEEPFAYIEGLKRRFLSRREQGPDQTMPALP